MFERVRNLFRKEAPPAQPVEPTTAEKVRQIAGAEESLVVYLKDVFHEKAYGEYVGGTLFVNREMLGPDGKVIGPARETYFLNVEDEDLPEELRKWVCLCYLKYKTWNHKHYDFAMKFVDEHHDTESTIGLLSVL